MQVTSFAALLSPTEIFEYARELLASMRYFFRFLVSLTELPTQAQTCVQFKILLDKKTHLVVVVDKNSLSNVEMCVCNSSGEYKQRAS